MRVDFWGNGRAAAIRRNSVAPRRIGASLLAYSFGVVLQNHQGAPRNLTIIKKPANDPEAADRPDLLGLRDRALIGMMVYSFARIGAVIQMKVGDYFVQGRRRWVRLHEKADTTVNTKE